MVFFRDFLWLLKSINCDAERNRKEFADRLTEKHSENSSCFVHNSKTEMDESFGD